MELAGQLTQTRAASIRPLAGLVVVDSQAVGVRTSVFFKFVWVT